MKCWHCRKEIPDHEEHVFIGLDGDAVHKRCEEPFKKQREKEMAFLANSNDEQFKSWMRGGELV